MSENSEKKGLSELEIARVLGQVNKWLDEYIDLGLHRKLSEDDMEYYDEIIEAFAELEAVEFGKKPDEWEPGDVNKICVERFPEVFVMGDLVFPGVSPVLTSFFTFLADKDYVKNGKWLAESARQIHEKMMELSESPEVEARTKEYLDELFEKPTVEEMVMHLKNLDEFSEYKDDPEELRRIAKEMLEEFDEAFDYKQFALDFDEEDYEDDEAENEAEIIKLPVPKADNKNSKSDKKKTGGKGKGKKKGKKR